MDPQLSVHRDLFAVGALDDRDAGSQLGVVQEVVVEVGQPLNFLFVEAGRVVRGGGFDERSLGGDPDFLRHARDLQAQRQADRLADGKRDARADERREALHGNRDLVRPERHLHRPEAPVGVGHDILGEVGGRVLEADERAGAGRPLGIEHDAFDESGGGLN